MPAQKPGADLDRIVATEPASTRPPGRRSSARATTSGAAGRSGAGPSHRSRSGPPARRRGDGPGCRRATAARSVPRHCPAVCSYHGFRRCGGIQARAVQDGDAEPRPEDLEHRRRRQLDRIEARTRLPTGQVAPAEDAEAQPPRAARARPRQDGAEDRQPEHPVGQQEHRAGPGRRGIPQGRQAHRRDQHGTHQPGDREARRAHGEALPRCHSRPADGVCAAETSRPASDPKPAAISASRQWPTTRKGLLRFLRDVLFGAIRR